MAGISPAIWEHFAWTTESAGVKMTKPPLWKKSKMGNLATVLSLEGSFVGLKIRTHVCFSWLMVMSFETVEFPGEGSGFASIVGYLKLRVRVPSGLRAIPRWVYGSKLDIFQKKIL